MSCWLDTKAAPPPNLNWKSRWPPSLHYPRKERQQLLAVVETLISQHATQ